MRFEVTFVVGQAGLGKLLGLMPPRTAQRAKIKPIPGDGDDDLDDDFTAHTAPAPGYGKPGAPAKVGDVIMRGDTKDFGTGENARICVETLEDLEAEYGIGKITRKTLHKALLAQGVPVKSSTGTISTLLRRDVLRCMGPAS